MCIFCRTFVGESSIKFKYRMMKSTFFISLLLMTLSFFSCVGGGGNDKMPQYHSVSRPNLQVTVPLTTTFKLSMDSVLKVPSVKSIKPLDSIGNIVSLKLHLDQRNNALAEILTSYHLLDSFPEDYRKALLPLLKSYPVGKHDSIIKHHYRYINIVEHTSFRLPELELKFSKESQTPTSAELTEQ
jgi:hypothetical protein